MERVRTSVAGFAASAGWLVAGLAALVALLLVAYLGVPAVVLSG